MTELAVIRPDDWNLALFVHVLSAFTLIGALVAAASYLFAARRDGSVELVRVGFRLLLIVALPALIATRLAGQWIASDEGLEDSDLSWIDTGFISTDVGVLVLVGATIAAGLALRRARRSTPAGDGGVGAPLAAWLVTILTVLYAAVIWLMATQPA